MFESFTECDTVSCRPAPYQVRIWFDKYFFVPLQTLDSVQLGRWPTTTVTAFFSIFKIMAKSKSGGTRTYIRGRVGSDVYSVGRDAKGKKQQVVRSLAETVSNPQTQAQMRGRMIMSTIAQAIAVLRPIVDHSFDGLSGARANLAEFTARNYALIKADVAANPTSGNAFGLNMYGEKGAKRGAYVISDGKANIPAALVLTKATGAIVITMADDNVTIGGLKAALGMNSEEYFTLVGIKSDGAAAYERFRVAPALSDATAITAENIANVFAVEGNAAATISVAANVITITLASVATCCAVIVSFKVDGKWIHNKAVLGDGVSFDYPSDIALPTYPVGAQAFLNGGDIFGQQESFNPGGGDEPTPSPTTYAVNFSKSGNGSIAVNAGGSAIASGAAAAAGTAIVVVITPEAGKTASCTVDGSALTLSQGSQAGTLEGSFSMPSHAVNIVANTAVNEPAPEPTGDAQLTSLTYDSQNVLGEENAASNSASSPVIAWGGTDVAGCYLILGGNTAYNVNDAVDVSSLSAGDKLLLDANSGSQAGKFMPATQKRVYLVSDNKVVQKCGRISYEAGD